jgi:hypothetical protein
MNGQMKRYLKILIKFKNLKAWSKHHKTVSTSHVIVSALHKQLVGPPPIFKVFDTP